MYEHAGHMLLQKWMSHFKIAQLPERELIPTSCQVNQAHVSSPPMLLHHKNHKVILHSEPLLTMCTVNDSSTLEEKMTIKKEPEDPEEGQPSVQQCDGLVNVWVKSEPESGKEYLAEPDDGLRSCPESSCDDESEERKVDVDMEEPSFNPAVILQEGPDIEEGGDLKYSLYGDLNAEEDGSVELYSNEDTLDNNIETPVSDEAAPSNQVKKDIKLRCHICNRGFTQRGNYNQHMTSHNRRFECDDCGSEFTKRGQLERHMLTHTQERRFECQMCPAKFAYKCNLDRHILLHTGEKRHVCTLCKKTFSQSWNLKEHLLVHSGHKRFTCNICLRKFAKKSNLMTHMMTHTGVKRYQCDLCPKQFAQRCHLKQHSLCHFERVDGDKLVPRKMPEKKFKCNVCFAAFTQNRNLKRHLMSHAAMKNVECEVCTKQSLTKNNLQRHLHCHATTQVKPEPTELCVVGVENPQIKSEASETCILGVDP